MATLRLFAGLRDVAGVSSVQLPGRTVGEVIAAAEERFGPDFSAGIERARVWRNGEEATMDDPVTADDEVAVIPPVSGGSDPLARPVAGVESLAALLLAGVLLAANVASEPAWWPAVLAGAAGAWLFDLATVASGRAYDLPVSPMLVSALAAMAAVHLLGPVGLGVGAMAAAVLVMAWGVASDSSRLLSSLAAGLTVSVLAAMGVASLMLARSSFEPGRRVVGVFLAVVIVATLIGALLERMPTLPFADPFTGTALGAIGASVAAAALWDFDLIAFLLAGVVLAAALVAGRGLGSAVRTGRVALIDPVPGALARFDGAVLAAALFYPVLRVVL